MLDTILSPLEYVVSAILLGVHTVLGPVLGEDSGWSWGPSIVVLVLVIRVCLIPLFVKQIRAQRGLQLLQPRMAEIRKKYAHDRQRQSEEMMKMYKETGTNPLSSCLPLLAQSPFFFGLYRVLDGIARNRPRGLIGPEQIASAKNARIFGAPLSESFLTSGSSLTRVVIVVMIVAMCASQFLTQRQIMLKNMPGGGDNPLAQQQKIMLYVFPLVFAVSGVYFPVGVLLYWLTTNLWTMGQQFYVIRRMPAPGSAAEAAFKARQAAKGKGSVEPEAPKTQIVRTQPKKQTRSQRQRPPIAGAAGESALSGSDVEADPDADSDPGDTAPGAPGAGSDPASPKAPGGSAGSGGSSRKRPRR